MNTHVIVISAEQHGIVIINNFPLGQEEQLLGVTALLNKEFLYVFFVTSGQISSMTVMIFTINTNKQDIYYN